MQRSYYSAMKTYQPTIHPFRPKNKTVLPCDVFINHRGIDTKKNVAGLLYDHLTRLNLRPFLDSKNMKPGDKLFDKINPSIRGCKLGVAIFSPRYCNSYFCLHELALIMEAKGKVLPVFCDIKPSELSVKDNGVCSKYELERFRWALEEAKYTVGLTFDSSEGDWPGFLISASDAIMKNLKEVKEEEEEERRSMARHWIKVTKKG